jgi:hypothetical protein
MQYWGGIQAQRRADQEEAAAKKKAAEDEARKEAYKATRVPDDAFRTKVTGFDNRDDIARNFATKAMEGYTNSANLAREAWDRGDKAEYQRYLDNMDKTLGEFDNFTNNEKHLAEIATNYATLAGDGKLNPVDEEYEQFMESFTQNNFEYYLDDNNIPHVRALLKDEEGNEYVKEVRASDLVNGNYRPYEKVVVDGKGGLIDEMLVGFGKRVYDENTGNYINTTQEWDKTNQASLDAKIDALTGDQRAMSSLLYQASGGTIKKMGDVERSGPQDDYTEEDKKLVEEYITNQVLAQYDEKEKLRYTGALTRAEAAKKKGRSAKEDSYSKLRFDAQRALSGDYTVLMDKIIDPRTKTERTVTDVVESPDGKSLIIVTESGKRERVPKTERGIIEFKLRNKPEYKGVDVTEVMSVDPQSYRDTSVGASEITALVDSLFDAEGKSTVDDEEFLNILNDSLGVQGEDIFTWSGNSLLINGVEVDTSNREVFRSTLEAALATQKNTQQTKEKISW